jgi:flavin-dependent dehydrogenase
VLRVMLERYMDERSISRKDAAFYSHMLPSLESPGWKKNRVAGDGWMAVGDAGGLVDPITGEGLYYAMKSGDMASQILLQDRHDLAAKTAAYRAAVAREFALDLEFAATLAKRVFLGSFMFGSVPARMVQLIRRSPRFCELMQDLFSGTQPYLELRGRLLKNLNGTLQEVVMNFFLNRVIPENARVRL